MPALTSILLASALAASAAGTAYQVKSSIDAKNDAQKTADQEEQQQQDLLNQQKTQQQQYQNQQILNQQTLVSQSMARAAAGIGSRSGTIATSPIGAPAPNTSGKTILGQ